MINIWSLVFPRRDTDSIIFFGNHTSVIWFGSKSEVPVPSRKLLLHFGVIDGETIKVDVARALEEERKL